jgi:formylglycine-generating enzyme required for sulfatase activity
LLLAPEAHAEREQRLEPLYVDGLGAFWVEDWDRACRCFQAIVDERPGYRDAGARLQEAERQRALAGLYAQAQATQAAGDWPGACAALEALVAQDPKYKDAADLLETAKVQAQLADHYAQARQLHRAKRWQAVVNIFDRITALSPDYPDPEGLLTSAKEEIAAQARRAELQDLYRRAVLAVDGGRWAEAKGLLAQVQEREPGYRETERLLARAESELVRQEAEQQKAAAEQRRQAQIAALYGQALELLRARSWQAALAKMAEIRTLDAGFGDPEGVTARSGEGLAQEEEEKRRQQAESQRREAEQRRQEQVAALYGQARQLARTGHWQQVMAKVREIKSLDPEFADPDRLVAQAQAGLEREEEEARRQDELAALYAEAVHLLRAGQYEEALQAWDQVRARDPHYPDRDKVEATARKKQAAKGEPAGWHRLPRWAWAAIAGLGLVVAAVVTVFVIVPAVTPTEPTITLVPTGRPQPGATWVAPTAGSEWAWSDGSVMLYVPAGAFWMGSDVNDPDADDDEKTQHQVTLDAFWIDRTEVTNGQYRRCVGDGACRQPSSITSSTRDSYYGNPDFDDYPVLYVDWQQAGAYCAWAGKRLPTEAEWEKAARGTDKRTYPWGEGIDCNRANYGGCVGETARVGNYPSGASAYGAQDMAGNVWEWTSSLYEPYPYDAQDGREDLEADGWRVVRGGSWYVIEGFVRAAFRGRNEPSLANNDVGFRCARSGSER